jgi:hypothetical protein
LRFRATYAHRPLRTAALDRSLRTGRTGLHSLLCSMRVMVLLSLALGASAVAATAGGGLLDSPALGIVSVLLRTATVLCSLTAVGLRCRIAP